MGSPAFTMYVPHQWENVPYLDNPFISGPAVSYLVLNIKVSFPRHPMKLFKQATG